MRNVAIGAVLGFGLVVLLLSIFNNEAPPQAPAPVAGAPALDAGSVLIPLNAGPVVVLPSVAPGARLPRPDGMRAMAPTGDTRYPPLQATPLPVADADAGR